MFGCQATQPDSADCRFGAMVSVVLDDEISDDSGRTERSEDFGGGGAAAEVEALGEDGFAGEAAAADRGTFVGISVRVGFAAGLSEGSAFGIWTRLCAWRIDADGAAEFGDWAGCADFRGQ